VPLPQVATTFSGRVRLTRRGDIGDVALGHALDAGQFAAVPAPELAAEDDLLQPAHLVRAEGQGPGGAHLDPGPAVLVVAGGDHGHAGCVQVELGEIGGRRQGQADVQHLAAGLQQAQHQGLFDRQAVGPEVVADDDLRLAQLVDVGPQAQAQRLDAQQVDVRPEQPAGVVFAETGRLDQRLVLIVGGVGREIGARREGHRGGLA